MFGMIFATNCFRFFLYVGLLPNPNFIVLYISIGVKERNNAETQIQELCCICEPELRSVFFSEEFAYSTSDFFVLTFRTGFLLNIHLKASNLY